MSEKTTEWQHIAIKKTTYTRLKGRAEGISVSIEQLLNLEEREIARRTAVGESRIARPRERMGGWLYGGRAHRHAGRVARTERARAVDRNTAPENG